MNIGSVALTNQFVLAPLAGVSCTAFRLLCKENGAGLIYTQMIDAELIATKSRAEVDTFLNIQEGERPVVVQLIGSSKLTLAKAVAAVTEFADIIDLNVGCIEEDYLQKGAGAALLQHLDTLDSIVRAMVDATDKPVTAKIRIGWDGQSINGVKVSQLLEDAGVQAVCIHGRTAQQKFSGKVNWTIMKHVKEKLHIPIIANGDVTSYAEGLALLQKTTCDYVMIGREARHRPWIFNQNKIDIKQQIQRFIELYTQYEKRQSPVEDGDHVFWMLRDYKTSANTKEVHLLRTIPQIQRYILRL
jgi:tRNA-dihydrouridine synthase B